MRFESYHPAISLLFFAGALASTVCFTHPAFAAVGLACSFAFMIALRGVRGIAYGLGSLVIGAGWAAAFTATTHFGVTVIGHTLVGNPLTVESLACGAVQGVQLATLLLWLNCLVAVFTSDKVEYLLGRMSPRAAMAFSLVMRFAPVVNARRRVVAVGQAGLGGGPGQGGVARRLAAAGRRMGAVASWAIERSAAVQASLTARGAQLCGRTAYSRYRFSLRDRNIVIVLVLLATVVGTGAALDQTTMQFAPELIAGAWTPARTVVVAAYAVFCLLPLALQRAGAHVRHTR